MDSQLVASFRPREMHIAGRLSSNDTIVPILYYRIGDILYPYLFTFDATGRGIDSLVLHRYYCVGNETGYASAFTVIRPNLSIVMPDSLVRYTLDRGGQPTNGPDTLFICSASSHSDESGRSVLQLDSTWSLLIAHVDT